MIKIAALENNEVINIYTYASMNEAREFFEKGAFGNADSYIKTPDDIIVGLGWRLVNGELIEPAKPEPETEKMTPMAVSLDTGASNNEIMSVLMELKEKVDTIAADR